jgi:antitoxin ParD1/3/4
MAAVKKLSIALTPEFAADIDEAVATGEFASTSEVIRDALRTWKRAREARSIAVEELRVLWRDGVASGDDGELDGDDIKRRGRERLAALRGTARS